MRWLFNPDLMRMQGTVHRNQYNFPRGDIAQVIIAEAVHRNALGGNHIFLAFIAFAHADNQRPYAVWITESQQTDTNN